MAILGGLEDWRDSWHGNLDDWSGLVWRIGEVLFIHIHICIMYVDSVVVDVGYGSLNNNHCEGRNP